MRTRIKLRERIRRIARHPRVKPYSRYLLSRFNGLHDFPLLKTSPAASAVAGQQSRSYVQAPNNATSALASSDLTHKLLNELASSLPTSNGCRFYEKLPLKVAIVTDIYMFNFYKDCFDECVYVNPENVDSVISSGFDVFLYITCWSGIKNDEWRGVKFREKPSKSFRKIINYCKDNKKVSIFQSIEDPSNFEYFLPIAEMFDCVFTSDVDSIARYREALEHDRVYYGEYGANPLICNPIGSARPALNAAFFAGSYPSRYPDRCTDMETVFKSIVSSGGTLVVADRNFGSKEENVQFPATYRSNIIDKFDHELLQRAHKLFRYNLNFNSIKSSPTMCAMRVYELQAMGRSIISNYARSVYNRFPLIKIVPEAQNLSAYFDKSENVYWHEYRRNMSGVLNVLSTKCSFDISHSIMETAGLLGKRNLPSVGVIVEKITSEVQDTFDRQTYPNKHLVLAEDVNSAEKWESIKQNQQIRFFAFLGNAIYGSRYLDSLLNAFKYTSCTYITKGAYSAGSVGPGCLQHEYTEIMEGKARSCFCAESFSPAELANLEPFERRIIPGGYAVDPFELNEEAFFASLREVESVGYALSVIVPVYNNGDQLIARCIESLSRSARWREMEVLLVDDGSTDGATVEVCRRLCNEHANIKAYYFPQGGSGSASRPRNKGIELSSSPLITFLDPDNEIAVGGYDTLLRIFYEQEDTGLGVDFVSGYQVKVGRTNSRTGLHSRSRCSIAVNPGEVYLEAGRFPVVSTQAAVIRKQFLLERNITFVEGAAGQDTLFGWQILREAKRVAFTNSVFILYYYEREQSITNVINASYFKKKLVLEREQVRWLKEKGLFNRYVDGHLDSFVRGWYLPKLDQVRIDEVAEARKDLATIIKLYGKRPKDYGV